MAAFLLGVHTDPPPLEVHVCQWLPRTPSLWSSFPGHCWCAANQASAVSSPTQWPIQAHMCSLHSLFLPAVALQMGLVTVQDPSGVLPPSFRTGMKTSEPKTKLVGGELVPQPQVETPAEGALTSALPPSCLLTSPQTVNIFQGCCLSSAHPIPTICHPLASTSQWEILEDIHTHPGRQPQQQHQEQGRGRLRGLFQHPQIFYGSLTEHWVCKEPVC